MMRAIRETGLSGKRASQAGPRLTLILKYLKQLI